MEFKEFDYTTQGVRIAEVDGEVWFVLKDVCDILYVKNYRNIANRLDDDEKGVHVVDTNKGKHKVIIINEPGLYQALFMMKPKNARGVSKEDIAKREAELRKFRRWVTHDVLPSIRKYGQYIDKDNKFNDVCPIKFDRAYCYKLMRDIIRARQMNSSNADIVWRNMYIGFSQQLGYNINKKAVAEHKTKIEWISDNGLMEEFCKFIQFKERGDEENCGAK